jgi:hypothetical protein
MPERLAEPVPSPAAAAPPPGPRSASRLHLAAIAGLAVAVYAATLAGTFDFDTPNLLLYNPAVHGLSLANLRAVWTSLPNGVEFLPVRDLTWMLDYELFGLRAFGYHLSNVLYYAGSCLVLYLVLVRALARSCVRAREVAFLAALAFVLHPVHVESVAGLAQRKDVVSGLLSFASLLAFQAFAARGRARHLAAAVLCLALAILSKATAVVVPGLALLLAGDAAWKDRRVRLGLVVLAAAAVALGAFLVSKAVQTGILLDTPGSPWLRLLTYARAASWYARMLLVPWPLSVVHELQPVTDPMDPGAIAALAAIALLSVLAARSARRQPVPALALGWFLCSIVPVSGLLPAPNLVAERYLFLPSASFAVLVAWLALEAGGEGKERRRRVALWATIAILLVHAGIVVVRVGEWRTNGELLTADRARNPGSARLTAILGRYHYVNRRYDEAFALFQEAKRLDPSTFDGDLFSALLRLQADDPAGALERLSPVAGLQVVDVQCVLGFALERMGRTAEAREAYQRALRANRLMGILFRTEAEAGLARLGTSAR